MPPTERGAPRAAGGGDTSFAVPIGTELSLTVGISEEDETLDEERGFPAADGVAGLMGVVGGGGVTCTVALGAVAGNGAVGLTFDPGAGVAVLTPLFGMAGAGMGAVCAWGLGPPVGAMGAAGAGLGGVVTGTVGGGGLGAPAAAAGGGAKGLVGGGTATAGFAIAAGGGGGGGMEGEDAEGGGGGGAPAAAGGAGGARFVDPGRGAPGGGGGVGGLAEPTGTDTVADPPSGGTPPVTFRRRLGGRLILTVSFLSF